jgi:predicted ferric reductase
MLSEKGLMLSHSGQIVPELSPISLIVRRQKGFTNKLYQKVAAGPCGNSTFKAYVQGPFGGLQSLDSYGTVILFAGGVGVTHMTSYLQHLISGYADGTVAVRRLRLIWTVQSWDHLEWIRPWMKTIIEMERCAEVLQVQIHVSRPETSNEVHNRNNNIIKMNLGRPNVGQMIGLEMSQQVGAMGVMVCGPGTLSDEVRYQCCLRQRMSNIDFFEESFSW